MTGKVGPPRVSLNALTYSTVPDGPWTSSGLSLLSRLMVWRSPGSPSTWSPWRCDSNIFMFRLNPTLAQTIWRCVPSPQSNIMRSRPSLTATLLLPLRAVGMLPLVPRKTTFMEGSLLEDIGDDKSLSGRPPRMRKRLLRILGRVELPAIAP